MGRRNTNSRTNQGNNHPTGDKAAPIMNEPTSEPTPNHQANQPTVELRTKPSTEFYLIVAIAILAVASVVLDVILILR